MNKITKYINERIDGNVFDKPSILEAYSYDRSVMKVVPRFVVVPANTDDIRVVVKFANELAGRGYHLPLAVRGSGLSKTGSDLSEGAVISLEKLDSVLEVDENSHLVRAQAGVTLGKLKAVLAAYGLTIPVEADPRQTLNDLITDCRMDDISSKYKSIVYYTERIEAVLSNGELIQTLGLNPRALKRKAEDGTFAGRLYGTISELLEQNFDIVEDLKQLPRDFGGYQMVTKVVNDRRDFDLLPLFFGDNNTLAVPTEVILRAEPILRKPERILATFRDADSVMHFVNILKKEEPMAINLFDSNVARIAAAHGKELEILPVMDKGYYVVASFDDNRFRVSRKLNRLRETESAMQDLVVESEDNAEDFENLGQLLVQFLNDEETTDRPVVIDDVFIPEESLSDFLGSLNTLEQTYGRDMPVMGSIATGLYSVRPDFNLADVSERKSMLEFMRSLTSIVRAHNGSLTGGSSEGRVKGAFLKYDPRIEKFYMTIKDAFDPGNIFNPEAKLGANLPDVVRHLRTNTIPGQNS